MRDRLRLLTTPGFITFRSECQTRSVLKIGLPPGAAAVLINQTHTYRDLFLPINFAEKQLFDSIDGERSIGEIVEAAVLPSNELASIDTAHSFFERLWWNDQVVFDTTRQHSSSSMSMNHAFETSPFL